MTAAIYQAQHLLCPLCKKPLACATESKSFLCEHNHTFDIAKQGYVNLLPVQQKRSKQPGDSKEMVLARKHFLELGYYQPLADALCQQTLESMPNSDLPAIVLDAGCGEGYYTKQLHQQLHIQSPHVNTYAFDISKAAITEAAKRSPDINWFVSTVKDIPLAPHSVDVLISVFSPLQAAHFQQLLTPNGTLITLSAGSNHLQQLKELIYTDVSTYDPDKIIKQLQTNFQLEKRQAIQKTLSLTEPGHIDALLSMTPHFWKASPDTKARLKALKHLELDVDVQLMTFKPLETPHD